MNCKLLSLLMLFISWNLFGKETLAKSKEVSGRLALPGELVLINGVETIFLEQDRCLLWPKGGSLLIFKDHAGTTIAQVDFSKIPKQISGAEAMNIEVEEFDLGGSHGSKKYLSRKKAPQGRDFDKAELAGKPQATEAAKVTKLFPLGIPLDVIEFPNGSFVYKWSWPDFIEEVYFDRRKTMIYNQQNQNRGPWDYSLRQYADGSFIRTYHSAAGRVDYTYDTNDQSYNLSFLNSKGEPLLEFSCTTQGCNKE